MTMRGSKVKVVQGSMCIIVYQFRSALRLMSSGKCGALPIVETLRIIPVPSMDENFQV